jgi:hypothetical protein
MSTFGLDCFFVVAVTVGTFFFSRLFGIPSRIPVHFAFFGSLAFFLGAYMTGSGFTARHYVTAGTPRLVWKVVGILCWCGALIAIVWSAAAP